MVLEQLTTFIANTILNYLKGATSIMMHGSTATNESSLYSDEKHDILLGNLGFTVITKSPVQDQLSYTLLLRFLRNIDQTHLSKLIERPLTLVKPFEVSLIPYRDLVTGSIPPDIWVFEMVNAEKIIFGDNMLQLFNANFGLDSGFKMIINRLFGLNLCVPLLARSDFNHKTRVLAVNYECVKGILGVLESLLVLLGKYTSSYSERGSLVNKVVKKYSRFFDSTTDIKKTFNLATELKLNPRQIDQYSPVDFWFQSRSLLETCLKIYNSQGITTKGVFPDISRPAFSFTNRIKELSRFATKKKFDPRLFDIQNLDETATKLMLSCIFSISPKVHEKSSKYVENLISTSRYANFLHTRGEWRQITDHIKHIQPD